MESIQKLDDLKGTLTDMKANLDWNHRAEVPGRRPPTEARKTPDKGLKRPVRV